MEDAKFAQAVVLLAFLMECHHFVLDASEDFNWSILILAGVCLVDQVVFLALLEPVNSVYQDLFLTYKMLLV